MYGTSKLYMMICILSGALCVFVELMLLGFISLLLTAFTSPITKICISEGAANSWHPCSRAEEKASGAGEDEIETESRRRLLTWSKMGDTARRILATSSGEEKCAEKVYIVFHF